jgi:hypothetical protein
MLTTVEAEIEVGGNIRLLEPIEVTRTTRAIVTLLEERNGGDMQKGNAQKVLEFLRKNRLPRESYPSSEEIEAQIKEARESWD